MDLFYNSLLEPQITQQTDYYISTDIADFLTIDENQTVLNDLGPKYHLSILMFIFHIDQPIIQCQHYLFLDLQITIGQLILFY